MADLPVYHDLNQKRQFFANGQKESFIINTRVELDRWFVDIVDQEETKSKLDATALIYRGLSEAKYKLLTSAQRIWILNEMSQWSSKDYLDFIGDLILNANKNTLIKKVFDSYNYTQDQRQFAILSLLQHYGAPTPLMDWTYNINVAFFFATDDVIRNKEPKTEIDNFFSIYRINKSNYKSELLNIIDFIPSGLYPAFESFKSYGDSNGSKKANNIFYISDFERKGESTGIKKPFGNLIIRTNKPLTSTYNQNIVPQEGLFIFNPFSKKTLEDIFNTDLNKDGWNLALTPFDCFNINKDLSEYLKRKVDIRYKINKAFIYPNLNDEAKRIKETSLNGLI